MDDVIWIPVTKMHWRGKEAKNGRTVGCKKYRVYDWLEFRCECHDNASFRDHFLDGLSVTGQSYCHRTSSLNGPMNAT
jgi:hypothetical protein